MDLMYTNIIMDLMYTKIVIDLTFLLQLQGLIDDCSCSVESIDSFNNVKVYPLLKSLLNRDYFRYWKVSTAQRLLQQNLWIDLNNFAINIYTTCRYCVVYIQLCNFCYRWICIKVAHSGLMIVDVPCVTAVWNSVR